MRCEGVHQAKFLGLQRRIFGLRWLAILGLLPPALISLALGGWTKAGEK